MKLIIQFQKNTPSDYVIISDYFDIYGMIVLITICVFCNGLSKVNDAKLFNSKIGLQSEEIFAYVENELNKPYKINK